jgi:hypothetical protein
MYNSHMSPQSVSNTAIQGFELVFFILIIVFVVHACFLAYHWFTYGDSRKLSMTALAIYLIGGAVLFMTLSITLSIL